MRKVFGAVVALWLLVLTAQFAQATTAWVWYQPTPYPAVRVDGVPINKDNIAIVHSLEGWVSSVYYNQLFQRTNSLQIGGSGDYEKMYLKFDMTGLPGNVDYALLYLLPYATGYTSTPYQACPVTSTWNSSMTWGSAPSYGVCSGFYSAPVANSWSPVWLAYPGGSPNWYNQWKANTLVNNGIVLLPQTTNNTFDAFYSTLYNSYGIDPLADARRPALMLAFTPTLELKMPLPGVLGPLKLTWLLTNEIGGYECKGEGGDAYWPDIAHTDSGSSGNYYAIDISWVNKDGNGVPSQYGRYNTPVLVAAGGKVIDVGGGNNPGDLNGFYIVIDHDSDGNIITGFSTRYLHLKQAAARANGTPLAIGNSVNPGDQIGIVGTTGKYANGNPTSTAEHLHFGVRYQNHGYSYIPELAKVVMDGLILKSYQTECAVNGSGVPTSRIRYYNSTNTPTGY